MNRSVKLFAAAALVLAAGQARAIDDNVDVKVTGQIVPPACVPAIGGGAVFDYGAIKAASLMSDDYTMLPQKVLSFNITCNSPMKVAFRTLDGRVGTGITPVGKKIFNNTVSETSAPLMGLGAFEGKNVGGFAMILPTGNITIDGNKGDFTGLKSLDNGQSWGQSGIASQLYFDTKQDFLSSVSIRNTNLPLAFTTLSADLRVVAVINKGSELNLTKVIPIDGQATIQMIYL